MAQVDSENSMAMPVDPTRRRLLSRAADVAGGGAAGRPSGFLQPVPAVKGGAADQANAA